MYWTRKQISIRNGIGNSDSGKVYCAHLSDDRNHDPVFTIESIKGKVSEHPTPNVTIIRSDNAPRFKYSQCFHDLQDLPNETGATVVRTYGIAGYGKGEINSVGGHVKNALRKSVERGKIILNSGDCIELLSEKFNPVDYTNPTYSFQQISTTDLEIIRKSRSKKVYDTVDGTLKFHVIVFRPNSDYILPSNQLCDCTSCLDYTFEDCGLFQKYVLSSYEAHKVVTRSDEAASADLLDYYNITSGSLVSIGCILQHRAKSMTFTS